MYDFDLAGIKQSRSLETVLNTISTALLSIYHIPIPLIPTPSTSSYPPPKHLQNGALHHDPRAQK